MILSVSAAAADFILSTVSGQLADPPNSRLNEES